MKRLMRKVIAMVCAVALTVTGLSFMPATANADDTWIHCERKTTVPDATSEDPYPEHTCWYLVSSFTGGANGNMDYCWINHDQSSSDPSKIKFRKNYSGIGNDGKPLDFSFGWDVAKLKNYGTDPLHPLDTDKTYKATIVINSSEATETATTGEKCKLGLSVFGTSAETALAAGDNTVVVEDITFDPDDNNKNSIDFNLVQLPLRGEITVKSIQFEIDTNAFITVPNTDNPNDKYGYNPEKDGVKSPWHLRATNNGSTQYGVQGYKFVDGVAANTLPGTHIKLINTVGVQETDSHGDPVLPENRWWWTAGILKGYATTAGLQPFTEYTGTITFNTDKATDTNCKLFVYVDGAEYPFTLQAGTNTLSIPNFMYKGQDTDIKFLFDELPKGAIVSISDITFTAQSSGGWTTVPNSDDTFVVGPWNMFGNFDPEHEGNWGVVQYKANKENPETYADYDIKAASVSGWLAWSSFVRLENYCADFLDEGDPYDLTITLNSSKATEPKNDPEALDKLVVLVGNETFKFDLTQGGNTLNIHSDGYVLGEGTNRHEQIMFELDGLVQGTELTIKDIQFDNYDNKGWTNVPNKRQTSVGMWTTLAEWSATRWSKLAYRPNASGSGLSAYDFKTRRTSKDYTLEASMAWLNDYLATAKDTKGNALDNGDPYAPTITMTAGGLGDSVSNYGKMWVNINGTRFSFDVKKGNNTYDLRQLTGNALVYSDENAQDVEFYFDELEDKSVINISKIEFAPLTEPGEDIPNGEAVSPEGTPWTLYAITNPSSGQYGALKYSIDGNPSDLSSLKLYVKSVSGAFIANATFAHLTDYLNNLKNGQNYKITINVAIDESSVVKRDVPYNKQLRVIVNEQNMDFDIPDTPGATTTLQRVFEYDSSKDKDISFQLDQLLQGTKFSVKSIVIEETTDPTQGPTTVNPTTENPSSVDPTSEGPTGTDTSTAVTSSKNDTTTNVIIPGKTKIKKIYKKKKSAKKLKLKLKKVKGAKGYQIAVYKSKKKAKKNKKALVKKFVKFKKKIVIKSKKLKKKKKLYVRARAYVLDADKVKVFGKWSPIKKAKIK